MLILVRCRNKCLQCRFPNYVQKESAVITGKPWQGQNQSCPISGGGVELVPRIGITQTSVSLGSFTDRVGADVGMPRTTHRSFNVGMTTKFKAFRPRMDGDLALQASIDFEKSQDGEETRINASGEDLISVAPGERLVLGLEGQGQRDRMFVKGGVRASVSNSENTRYSGHITFGMTF